MKLLCCLGLVLSAGALADQASRQARVANRQEMRGDIREANQNRRVQRPEALDARGTEGAAQQRQELRDARQAVRDEREELRQQWRQDLQDRRQEYKDNRQANEDASDEEQSE